MFDPRRGPTGSRATGLGTNRARNGHHRTEGRSPEVRLGFSYSLDGSVSHVMYRTVKPSRAQSDYGPKEWSTTAWSMAPFEDTSSTCTLLSGENGTVIRSNLPIPDTISGEVHYKAMLE